jgi:hypothetical protein
MKDCKHQGRRRSSPLGEVVECGLIADLAGARGTSVPLAQCDPCPERDDGRARISDTLTRVLKLRLVEADLPPADPNCKTCGGWTLTAEEALTRLKLRLGAQGAADALVEAVRRGMPRALASELARKHLKEAE